MDRTSLLRLLAQTERDIAEDERLIENQERTIAELERTGRDAWKARKFFDILLEGQTYHQQDRVRLRKQIAEPKD